MQLNALFSWQLIALFSWQVNALFSWQVIGLFCNLVEKNMFYHEFILQQFESGFTVHAPFHYLQLVDESFCNAVGNIESDSVSYSLEISFNTYNKCLQ